MLLLIDINTFLNYSLVETNGAIWCAFREIKQLCIDLVQSRSVPSGYFLTLLLLLSSFLMLSFLFTSLVVYFLTWFHFLVRGRRRRLNLVLTFWVHFIL